MKKIIYLLILITAVIIAMYFLSRVFVAKPKGNIDISNNNGDEKNDNQVDIYEMISNMSVEDKVGQLFIAAYRKDAENNNVTILSDEIKESIKKHHLGGVVLFNENIENEAQVKALIKDIKETNDTPIFVAVDSEGGLVDRIASKLPVLKLPYISELGRTNNSDYSYEYGKILGRRLASLGFNLDFAPVSDLSNDKVIAYRSFGSNSEDVGKMVASNIKGIKEFNIATTLKHFPGLRSSNEDTHTQISTSNETLENLKTKDFIPFKYGIDAGSNIIMINHVEYLKLSDKKLPASLNKDIYDILRRELNFDGLIVTDGLEMGAITKQNIQTTPAFAAFDAGADLLLLPQSLDDSYNEILDAVKSGKISSERLNESIYRILKCKYDIGLLGKQQSYENLKLDDANDQNLINKIK